MQNISFTEKEKEIINQGIKLMGGRYSRIKTIEGLDLYDIMKEQNVIDYRRIDSIFKLGSPQTIKEVIVEIAKEVCNLAENFMTEELNKLHWLENKKKIIDNVYLQFKTLFNEVEKDFEEKELADKFIRKLSYVKRDSEGLISAKLTAEEADELKIKLADKINAILDEAEQSSIDTNYKEKIKKIAENEVKELSEFIEQKLKEEPVRLYYYKTTGGRVAVKLKWNKSSFKYSHGRGKEVSLNRGKDSEEYPLIISANYIMDFLCQNDIRDVDLWIDPKSVEIFYSYDGIISANLTKKFVDDWWNYDCPIICRHAPNKHEGTNMLGMPICHFTNTLVESTLSVDYIDEDITEEEIENLTKGREYTRIAQTMHNVLKARKLEKDQSELEKMMKDVESFDAKVQECINKNTEEILRHLVVEFKDRVIYKVAAGAEGYPLLTVENIRINDNFGFDCGFCNIMTTDKDYTTKRNILRQIKSEFGPYMNIHMPYSSQSLTLMREQFRKTKEVVFRETGIELYANFQLD